MDRDQHSTLATCFLMMAIVMLAVALRLSPLAPNFAPIAACGLLAGAVISDRRLALLVPLIAMLVSDLCLGFYQPGVMIAVYASLALPVFLGRALAKKRSAWRIGGLAICSSLIFFLTSNLAVWAFVPWYAHTAEGLMQCYVSALPFLRNTIAGDLFWSFALFAAYGLCIESVAERRGASQGRLACGTNGV